jgi:hypothetical protein
VKLFRLDLDLQAICIQNTTRFPLNPVAGTRLTSRIRIIGHNMRGTGKGYGFEPITEIGKALEHAGQSADAGAIRFELTNLSKYLSEVDVVYK